MRSICCASKMHSASPRLTVSSLSLHQKYPVCVSFAHLDWGYWEFSLFEAGVYWLDLFCVRDGDAQRSQLGLSTCASIAVGQRECRGIDIADGIGKIGETNGTLS